MIAKTAHYEVPLDRVEDCLAVIREFTSAVRQNEPGTLLYLALHEADAATRFTHVMAFRDAEAEAAHRVTPWVKRFVEQLYPNTIDGVTFRDQSVVAGL